MCVSAQSCPTLCNPMNSSPPDSYVHGIFRTRIPEWVAIPFCRDLPHPGTEPQSPALQANSLPSGPQGKPLWKTQHLHPWLASEHPCSAGALGVLQVSVVLTQPAHLMLRVPLPHRAATPSTPSSVPGPVPNSQTELVIWLSSPCLSLPIGQMEPSLSLTSTGES